MKNNMVEGGHVLTKKEFEESLNRATIQGQSKAFAEGTVSALSGEGDPTYVAKVKRKIEADKAIGKDPRGIYAQSGAAGIKR